MYSLYRAWFGVDEEAYPRLETLSPPDTLVRVGNEGEHQFVAHRGVLAAHSGYLKALLAASPASSTSSARDEPNTAVASVSVSSVGGEAFAPLLNYMYTGRLEVTTENIYSVLLATHLLHMPGALEQCRAALLRLRGVPSVLAVPSSSRGTPPPPPGTILRPVPNRLVGAATATAAAAPLCWSQPTPLYPSSHLGLSHLANFQLSSGMPILASPPVGILREIGPTNAYTLENDQDRKDVPRNGDGGGSGGGDRAKPFLDNLGEASPSTRRACLEVGAKSEGSETRRDTTSGGCGRRRRCRVIAHRDTPEDDSVAVVVVPLEIDEGIAANERIRTDTEPTATASNSSDKNATTSDDTPATSSGNSRSKNLTEGSSNGVVYDVACCDGPVRFHRVLNENYVSTSGVSSRRTSGTPFSDDEPDIRTGANGENDENGKPEDGGGGAVSDSVGSSGTGGASYTCGYCRHTFKSHYCYRKHARRHLLPSTEGGSGGGGSGGGGSGGGASGGDGEAIPSQTNRPEGRRREVKLLDLNVQYYPCKICGSKFPSYYFVHKHKKLCHANADDGVASVVSGESSSQTARPTADSTDQ